MTHDLEGLERKKLNGTASARLRHPLADIDPGRFGRALTIFRPSTTQIEELVDRARQVIPGLAENAVVRRVVKQNPDALWAIARASARKDREPEGFIATLPLTTFGLQQLIDESFAGSDPDPRAIAAAGEKPAAIYIWAAFAPGRLIGAVPLVFEKLSASLYRDADIIARATTAQGRRLSEVLGLKSRARINGMAVPHLYVFERSSPVESNAPVYDSYRVGLGERELSVTVAHSLDDLMRVVSMRAAVYMCEQECPFDEEFDGNDMSATHLLGYVGSEPAGCLRIHCFADFAKLERLAVRREFRHTRLAFMLVKAGIELCQKKGYRRLYGHAQRRLVNFWTRFGFHPLEGGQSLVFSDFDYVEMIADLDQDSDAVSIGNDPYIIIRPEGRWHMPGVLERSASRGATMPAMAEAAL